MAFVARSLAFDRERTSADSRADELVRGLVPFPNLIEPKKFNPIVDTGGCTQKHWDQDECGARFVFF
jgi:hypothetical protein